MSDFYPSLVAGKENAVESSPRIQAGSGAIRAFTEQCALAEGEPTGEKLTALELFDLFTADVMRREVIFYR